MRILIVRHGDPDYEKDSLTPKGFREAELLADRLCKLDVKAFYCSPLGRAQDTARPTLQRLGRSAETLDWLQEFRGKVRRGLKVGGCWDRLPSYWCREDNYYSADAWLNTRLMQSKNVEKEYRYVCRHLDTLLARHGYRHNGRVFDVVDGNHFVALPTSVTTVVTEEREQGIATFRVQQFGDLSHLYAAGEPPAFAARFCECFEDDTRH